VVQYSKKQIFETGSLSFLRRKDGSDIPCGMLEYYKINELKKLTNPGSNKSTVSLKLEHFFINYAIICLSRRMPFLRIS
jgi:hypothetical protein